MSYQIVTAKTIDILVEKVNILQRQGWITQGGAELVPKYKIFMQTMISMNDLESQDDDDTTHVVAFTEIPVEHEITPLLPPGTVLDYHKYPYKNDGYFETVISEELSFTAYRAIKLAKITTVGELLSAVQSEHFNKYTTTKIKDEILDLIKAHRW